MGGIGGGNKRRRRIREGEGKERIGGRKDRRIGGGRLIKISPYNTRGNDQLSGTHVSTTNYTYSNTHCTAPPISSSLPHN